MRLDDPVRHGADRLGAVRRLRASATCLSAVLAAVALAAGAAPATAARVLNVHDEGHLRFIASDGSELLDGGAAEGTFTGRLQVRFVYDGEPAVSARFTISGRGGSISGKAKATLNNLTSAHPSFRGALTITGGSGRYTHVHGTGELFGVFTRRGSNRYGLLVQAIGEFPY
jgi:hypothetical protein